MSSREDLMRETYGVAVVAPIKKGRKSTDPSARVLSAALAVEKATDQKDFRQLDRLSLGEWARRFALNDTTRSEAKQDLRLLHDTRKKGTVVTGHPVRGMVAQHRINSLRKVSLVAVGAYAVASLFNQQPVSPPDFIDVPRITIANIVDQPTDPADINVGGIPVDSSGADQSEIPSVFSEQPK